MMMMMIKSHCYPLTTTTLSTRRISYQNFLLRRWKSSIETTNTNTIHNKQSLEKGVREKELAEVEEIAKSVGVRLTLNELSLLQKKLSNISNINNNSRNNNNIGPSSKAGIEVFTSKALQERTTREICLSVVCNAENPLDKWGVRVIKFFDYAGTALFAIVGTQVAGDAGMNIVGCSLVGCVAALGGASLNAMLYGGASPFLGRPGVRFVVHPSFLIVALVSSVLTFVGWPYYCQIQAEHYLKDVIGHDRLNSKGCVDKKVFLETWERDDDDETFRKTIRDALPKIRPSQQHQPFDNNDNDDDKDDGSFYFDHLDIDGSGDLDLIELEKLVQHRFYNGWETYALDTLALGSLSIAAVVMSVKLGLHPLVAATSGVTVCFGGILRDLLADRDYLAVGSQSYAFATGASSFTYIFLRELALRRIIILPLVVRTFVSAGMCIGLRSCEYIQKKPLLRPMHH